MANTDRFARPDQTLVWYPHTTIDGVPTPTFEAYTPPPPEKPFLYPWRRTRYSPLATPTTLAVREIRHPMSEMPEDGRMYLKVRAAKINLPK